VYIRRRIDKKIKTNKRRKEKKELMIRFSFSRDWFIGKEKTHVVDRVGEALIKERERGNEAAAQTIW